MALTYLPMLLQQDVNKLYPDILNMQVVPPPHWNGRVSHTFFLKRRAGINSKIDFGGDKVLDYLQYDGHEYGLIKDGTDIKVMKDGSTTTLFTGTHTSNIHHKLMLVGSVSGVKQDSGTAATSSVTLGIYKITDATKTWTVNAWAGKYIYIYSADTGTGEIFRISSNTATELTLARGWPTQPTNISYYIFDNFSEVPAVISNDGMYVIHNDTAVHKISNIGTVVDAVYNLGRIMAVDVNDNVIVTYEGYNDHFMDETSIVGTYSGVKGMCQFQDFTLMLSDTRIGMIKKEDISIYNSTTSSNETTTTFKPLTITTQLGTFGSNSYTVYNQGLYVFTSAKRFVALTIQPAGTDRYSINQEDQGIYIQQFLDNTQPTDEISIAINPESITLNRWDGQASLMFIYDTYYKFRHRRDTQLQISNTVVFNQIYYLGDKVYEYDLALTKDYGQNDYVPNIRVIFGEADIFSLKNILSHKIYLGKNTSPQAKITYKCHIDGGNYLVNLDMSQLIYLYQTIVYTPGQTLGSTLLGIGPFGGYNGLNISQYFVSPTNIIEIPLTLTCSLMEVNIEGDFEFGGMLFAYEQMEAEITPINSVLGV